MIHILCWTVFALWCAALAFTALAGLSVGEGLRGESNGGTSLGYLVAKVAGALLAVSIILAVAL